MSTYIDDLEQEYKKRIFDYFINKGNKIDNNFKKISMKAFSLYNTLTNYFEKKQKAFYKKYKNWIDKHREFYLKYKSLVGRASEIHFVVNKSERAA